MGMVFHQTIMRVSVRDRLFYFILYISYFVTYICIYFYQWGVSSAEYWLSICLALKHWTSKLTSYADLDSVTTFGFRGEALSSLCALSDLQIITATAAEAPKGTKLEFEMSGKLKSRSVTAAQKGATVLVENIFKTLPVRRKELERNIKREYTKVLGILQAYAGVCVGVKFSVFNQPAKGYVAVFERNKEEY